MTLAHIAFHRPAKSEIPFFFFVNVFITKTISNLSDNWRLILWLNVAPHFAVV